MSNLTKMIASKRVLVYLSIYTTFLVIGLYLRLRGLPGEMGFWGDQGQDLLVALRIVRGEFYPLVGPILSLKDFFTPPTYYYFLATTFQLFKSEVYIIYFYVFMNIASGILFALYIKRKVNSLTALLFFVFYMTTYYSVNQSYALWQPFPVTFFVAIALWLLSTLENKFSYWRIYLSIVLFCIAVTTYFGTVILIPLFLFQLYKAFRINTIKTHSLITTLLSFFGIIFLFYIPWLVNEFQNNFPTYHAVISPLSYGPGSFNSHFVLFDSLRGILERVIQPIQIIFTLANPPRWDPSRQMVVNITFFVSLTFLVFKVLSNRDCRNSFGKFSKSISLKYIILGIVPMIFYQTGIQYHRLQPLVPFIFLILAYIINLALTSRNKLLILTAILLFSNIVMTVFSYSVPYYKGERLQTYKEVGSLYTLLKNDVASRNFNLTDYDFRIYTSGQEYYYETQALWYLLKKNDNYPVDFNHYGNDTNRVSNALAKYKYAYLICFGITNDECQKLFNPGFKDAEILKRFDFQRYNIYLVKNPTNIKMDIN